jgi:hypothetical protein
VLERMEALEHRERRVAPRTPEAGDQRSVLHAAMMPRACAIGYTVSARV